MEMHRIRIRLGVIDPMAILDMTVLGRMKHMRMVKNRVILLFINRIPLIHCDYQHILQMSEIYRCNDGSILCQVIAVLGNLTDISDKQSLHIFLADIGGDNTFSHSNLIILVIQDVYKRQGCVKGNSGK